MPGGGIPHLDRFLLEFITGITCCRGDACSAWRPRHGPERTSLLLIGEQVMPTHRIPHLEGAILARRDNTGPVRGPGYCAHPCRVTSIGLEAMPACGIPDLDGVVIAPCGDAGAIGGPSHAKDSGEVVRVGDEPLPSGR